MAPACAPEPGEYRSFKLVDRKAIPKRWKAEAYQRTNGCCYVCQKAVPPGGPDVQYDHRTPLWLDETAHKVENIFPICTTPCHRDKTANEAPIRAKVLRNMRKQAGVKKKTREIAKRANPWPKGRKLQSAKFAKPASQDGEPVVRRFGGKAGRS